MPQSKEVHKEYMRRYRDKNKGVTSGGITEPWYPNKRTDEQGNPITPVTLSDGQKWYPNPLAVFTHPIKKELGKRMCFDNGSYIHIKKLVDPKSRGLITYLTEHLNPACQSNIRVGVYGPTIAECKELLEVTA